MDIRKKLAKMYTDHLIQLSSRDERTRAIKRYAILSVLIVIIFLIIFNVLFSLLTDDRIRVDLTSNQMNTLTPHSINLVRSLDQEVQIYGLFEKPKDLSDLIYQFFVPILEEYEKYSGGKITVEYVNPNTRPGIYLQIDPSGNENFEEGTYVIKVGDSYRVIDPFRCIIMTYLPYMNVPVPLYNNVEPMFTGTIVQLSQSSDLRKIYMLSGHREASHTMLNTVLSYAGFTTEDLNLYLQDSLPEDCQLIIVNSPLEDFSEAETQLLIDYFKGGGRIIFAFQYSGSTSSFDNINSLLAEMNVKFTNSIVAEYNTEYLFNVTERYIFKSSIVRDFSGIDSPNLVVGYARGLQLLDPFDTSVDVKAVVQTSPSALLIEGENQSEEGAQNIALLSSKTTPSGEARLFVFGTSFFTSDEYLAEVGINDVNSVFIKNVVQFMYDEEQTELVGSKSFPSYQLSQILTVKQQSYWSVFLMSIIPLGFILSGMVVYLKRKNK